MPMTHIALVIVECQLCSRVRLSAWRAIGKQKASTRAALNHPGTRALWSTWALRPIPRYPWKRLDPSPCESFAHREGRPARLRDFESDNTSLELERESNFGSSWLDIVMHQALPVCGVIWVETNID